VTSRVNAGDFSCLPTTGTRPVHALTQARPTAASVIARACGDVPVPAAARIRTALKYLGRQTERARGSQLACSNAVDKSPCSVRPPRPAGGVVGVCVSAQQIEDAAAGGEE